MVRRWLVVLSSFAILACPCASALAQQSLRSHLQPVTAPIRRAGVYHVATGTWTRNASLTNVTGPDVIYNNTCAAIYYSQMQQGDVLQHRSRIPSTSGPTTPSIFYGTAGLDEAPGCHDAYTVNGFEVSYCSSATSTVDWQYDFASSYTLCASGDMVSQYSVLVTGLPGGATGGAQACWIVDVDLSGHAGGGIVMSADGDGTYNGGSSDTFGFGFGPANGIALSDFTGPLLAGDYTWTGGPVVGALTPCTGTDGTIWDNPINLAEPGTGMTSNNFVRWTGASPSMPSGCYSASPVHADFYLKLFADPQCPKGGWVYPFCFPGEGGIRACTTCSPANPPSPHGRGCDNFGQHTGGAMLTSTGVPSIAGDTIVFTSSFENNTAFSVLLQGTSTTNVVFGAGVRCVAGNLKRLYIAPASAGVFTHPVGADPSVHARSAALGYVIHPPITLFYQAYYRDPNASSHCGGATFNSTAGGSLNWVP
jgi:hypothetical protein